MTAKKQSIIGTCAGFLLAMAVCAPVVADDTELFRVSPTSNGQNKPNILFIIDTSSSMNSTEDTPDRFDATESYPGDCDSNRNYWLDIEGVEPDCADTEQYIDKDNFFCNAVLNQMEGLGSVSTTFVQYRDGGSDGTSSGPKKWQTLAAGYNSEPVECSADAGIHGDGNPTRVWAKAGSDIDPWYTDNPNEEIDWSSVAGGQTYTIYDGNYLNWAADPEIIRMSRINIVKEVLRVVFSSISNVNVGVERFNDSEGGTITMGMIDLDTNRAAALAAVEALTPNDHTTIAESLYESALYWRGLPVEFGDIDGDTLANGDPENVTDPTILASTSPKVYRQPDLDVCAKNYNVLLSDGRAGGNDNQTPALTPTLPGFQTILGRTQCDDLFGGAGICMDDISEYLSKGDIDSVLPGDQLVVTHTIGFNTNTENLESTAERSGGNYYLADDAPTLARAMQSIVTIVEERDLSFSAPAVSVNAFNRTQNLNDLYISMFRPKGEIHWPGNLKKYRVSNGMIVDANGLGAINPTTGFFDSSAQSLWTTGTDGNVVTDGGAAHELPSPTQRNLYTNNSGNNLTSGINAVSPSNAGAFTDADFGLTGTAGEPSKDEIIRWARGEDLADEDDDPSTTVRYSMGDPLHSQPAAVVYGGTPEDPEVVVFSATNEGYLHAIDGETGAELWSFVPKRLLERFNALYFNPESQFKLYGLDGNIVPVVKDENHNGLIDGDDFVYILFGQRRGGDYYYALDVTDKNAPKLLWTAQLPGGSQSWSTPVIARIDIDTPGQNADNAVVVLGGGYDFVHDTPAHPASPDSAGASIHMLDLVSGAELWRASSDLASDLRLSSMTRAIPTRILAADLTGDGMVNRMYASDLGGQLLRFDITNGETPANLVAGGVIAQLGAEGLGSPTAADTRRFYNTPDASIFTDKKQDRNFISLSIGSGYRAHPLDNSATDRFYSVRDPDVFKQLSQSDYNNYDIITDSDLVEIGGDVRSVIDSSKRGWKFTMPSDQKVIAGSVTFDNSVYFIGFSPQVNGSGDCQPTLGRNFLYRVSVVNGDPVGDNVDVVAMDAADADAARVTQLAQGGIAPKPTFLFPSPDDPNCNDSACTPSPLACVGVECFDPGFANNPVRTLWAQDGIE